MSFTSHPSKVDDLAAHIPDVQSFAPGLMTDLGPLLNAARAATGVGEGRDVMILNADLDNLREGITTLVTLKSTGFASQDIVDAEKDIRLLMTDMQNRCGRILSDKSKMLRIHTQTAARRVDPDIKPQDVTDAFRTIFASPAPVARTQNQVVTTLALPEVGGQPGRVVGDILFAAVSDDKSFGDAAPSDTTYLPPGHMITLQRGEQILLRNAGAVWGDRDISINDFNTRSASYLLHAQADGVQVFGPATLAAVDLPDLITVKAEAEDALNMVNTASFIRKFTSTAIYKDEHGCTHGEAMVVHIPAAVILSSLLGGLLFGLMTESFAIALGIWGISVFAFVYMLSNIEEGTETQIGKLTPLTKNTKKKMLSTFMCKALKDPNNVRTFMEHRIAGLKATFAIRSTRQFTFFPARKVVTNADGEVQVIRPQAALPSPQTDIDLSFTPTALKEKV